MASGPRSGVVRDGLDNKKSSAPSHTHKVICPHCKIEINIRNLKRHIKLIHPEKDSEADASTFLVKDSQTDKVLIPTKVTSFFGVKRKDGDSQLNSQRPVKIRNASGDSAVSLDFSGESGEDDSAVECVNDFPEQDEKHEETATEVTETEKEVREEPTACGEERVIESPMPPKEAGDEPVAEKEGSKSRAESATEMAEKDLESKEEVRKKPTTCGDECVIDFPLSCKEAGDKPQVKKKPESAKRIQEVSDKDSEKEKSSFKAVDLLDLVINNNTSSIQEDLWHEETATEVTEYELVPREEVREEPTACVEECVIDSQEEGNIDTEEGGKEESLQLTLLVKNQLLLTQALVKLDKLTINREYESSKSTDEKEKTCVLELGKDIETKFVLASSVTALEKLGFSYCQENNLFRCNECGAVISYVGENDFTDRIQPNEFRNVKKKLRKHLMTTKHLKQVEVNNQDKEDQVKNMSANEKAGMTVGTLVYTIIKKRRPVRDLEEDLYLLHKQGLAIGNINHSYQLVYGLRPYLAAEIRNKKKSFFSSTLDQTGFLPVLAMSSDGATHKRRSRQVHGGTTPLPDTHGTDSPLRAMSLGVDVMATGKTGEKLVDSILER